MATIGFVGLGNMGAPMAENLLKHQHEVRVFDVVPAAVKKLVAAGAQAAATLREVSKNADFIITMLPTGQHVKTVYAGDEGLLAHAKPNTLFMDCSTISVDEARELHRLASATGMPMIDAPVSGGIAAATAGTLTFMVGGAETEFARSKPILDCLGKAVIHAGAIGNGQAAKICNNMLLGISMIAVSEAFALGKKLGLDPQKLFEISSQASGQCWSLTSYCPAPGILPNVPSSRGYAAGFTTAMMLKDLRLSQIAAQSVGAATPLGAEATALYTLFNNQGQAQVDFSAIIKMIAGEE
jgi:3-hydroxyisobutyrate dehydrogenase